MIVLAVEAVGEAGGGGEALDSWVTHAGTDTGTGTGMALNTCSMYAHPAKTAEKPMPIAKVLDVILELNIVELYECVMGAPSRSNFSPMRQTPACLPSQHP